MRLFLVVAFCLALPWCLPPPAETAGSGLHTSTAIVSPSATWAPAIHLRPALTTEAPARASPPLSAHPGRSERLALAPGYWLLV